MSFGSQPTPPSPTESAQAQASSQLAGQMFQARNQPLLGYEDAVTRAMLQPYTQQLQDALTARSAYNQAKANRYIQSQTNPAGVAASGRVAQLYGITPAQQTASYFDPSVFNINSGGVQLPSLNDVSDISKRIGGSLGRVAIGGGGDVQISS
jgi:hypothetical protein